MATHGGENGSGHAAEWRFARVAKEGEGALAVAGDKLSIRAARFKISASVDARDPRPVLPLAHGDPSVFPAFRTAAEAEDAVAAALRTGKFNCYPAGVGLLDARRSLAEHLSSDLPYKLSTDDIFLTAGGTQAIEVVVSVLAQPGTNILLPRPGYPNYEARAGLHNLEVRRFDLIPERGWEIDIDSLESIADKNTTAVVIINPNNPCGSVYTHEHLAKVAEVARKLGILVIADEQGLIYRWNTENWNLIDKIFLPDLSDKRDYRVYRNFIADKIFPALDGDEHGGTGSMYEHAAAAAGASNMLSEMFNFPAPPSGPSATELLASQMNANYRFGLRQQQGPGGVAGLSGGDGGWFGAGAAGRAGLVLGGASMGSLGETSSPKQQQAGSMAGLATDPAAAMQLFLMNPQQQSRSSPTSPPPSDVQHHEAFQAFGAAAGAAFGGAGTTGVVEGQGLSLSLSPSLQQLEMAKQAEELRVRDGVLYFNRQQQQGPSVQQVPMALHGQVGALGQQLHVGYGPAGVAGVLRNSKYTRAAQELLEEFCSVGRGQIKGGARGGRGASASNPNASNKGGASSSGAAQSPSSASKEPPQLSPADRFEHQRKKAKLISMLDEVDRRYNHYCDQMQMVVNFFDSVMGFGAATPYTALAQKAMSRHFRCLKDAIAAQLRTTCELLGEKDAGTSSGLTKGETPRLRAIDQSLRQQRAFHHMGMMEQEAWRPQRGLPERSVNILRSWLFEHFLHPYPSDADKHLLARQTGLSRNQVSNWFINARVRLWKPMIEEMYQQECRELEGSSAGGGGGGPESGNDPSGADDSHSPTTTGAAQLPQQQQQHGTVPGVMMPHKPDPGAAGPSAADAAFVGIDPVELLGGDAHVGGGADDLYGRFEPGVRVRYGPAAAAGAAAGDVSLTLGLQHAGTGNAGPDGTGRFSLRDYSGC